MQDIHLTGTTSTPAIDTDWTSGRVSLRVDGGQGSLRLHTLPGSGGETSISITGVTLENGSALQEGSAAHRIRIKTP